MFYFIVYKHRFDTNKEICKVIDQHPIKWYNTISRIIQENGDYTREIVLLNWKQISEEEFNMWGEE